MLVVVCKFLSQLRPDACQLQLCCLIGVLIELRNVYEVLVVNVQYNEHVAVDSIVNSLLDIVHPVVFNVVLLGAVVPLEMLVPGHRYTDSVETCLLYSLELVCVWFRLTPRSCELLGCCGHRQIGVAALKRVAEIPAYPHLGHDALSILT